MRRKKERSERRETEFESYHRRMLPDYDEFIRALRRPQKRSIRVNTLKASKGTVEGFLKEKGISFAPVSFCPYAYYVDPKADLDTVEHQLGYYYVQTVTSLIPSLVLDAQPGETVLDLCAAPGSKTTHLAQMMENSGVLVANEPNFKRIRALVINLQKAGVSNCAVTRRDGCSFHTLPQRFDKVLVDAPCSDVGTARKNPRVLMEWRIDKVKKLSNLQKKLASSAYGCLRPGGTMVYSTCTSSREENEDVIEHLLSEREDAVLEKITLNGFKARLGQTKNTKDCARVMPQDNDSETYFIAKVKKNA